MKKILLCLALCSAIFLVGCNDNKEPQNVNPSGEGTNINQSEMSEEDEAPIVSYDTPDFSEKAGFKVNLGASLQAVTYDSIFLINKSSAQLDLIFPDQTIGTLLVEPMGGGHIYEEDERLYVGDVEVAVQVGADDIIVYEWERDNYLYTYSSKTDIRGTDTLSNLVNDVSVEVTDDNMFIM